MPTQKTHYKVQVYSKPYLNIFPEQASYTQYPLTQIKLTTRNRDPKPTKKPQRYIKKFKFSTQKLTQPKISQIEPGTQNPTNRPQGLNIRFNLTQKHDSCQPLGEGGGRR